MVSGPPGSWTLIFLFPSKTDFNSFSHLFHRRQPCKINSVNILLCSTPLHALPPYFGIIIIGGSLSLVPPTLIASRVGFVFFSIYSTVAVRFFLVPSTHPLLLLLCPSSLPLTSRSRRLIITHSMLFHKRSSSSLQLLFSLPLTLDYISDMVMYCNPKHALGSPYKPKSALRSRTASVGEPRGWA